MKYEEALAMMKEQIQDSINAEEEKSEMSWNYETGVLISRECAEIFINEIQTLKAENENLKEEINKLDANWEREARQHREALDIIDKFTKEEREV